MSTYTIGEAALRSGFSASALRYYEGIGLVAPPSRSGAGYRLYDDDSLQRLAFIARAKGLGCTLEEITDLVAIWDGQRCGPVQRRFHDVVTTKIRDVEARLAELSTFAGQLRVAADQLGGEPVDGPCGPGCACTVGDGEASYAVTLGRRPVAVAADVPIACSLDAGARGDRLAEWAHVLGHATRRTPIDGGVRVELGAGADLGELGRLVAAEQGCCAFFAFTLTVDTSGVALEVRAPAEAAGLVADVFGPAA